MKGINFFLLIVIISASSFGFIYENSNMNNENKITTVKFKRYGIKSGIVEYESTGSVTGTTILYFDDWGNKEAKFEKTEIKMMAFLLKKIK